MRLRARLDVNSVSVIHAWSVSRKVYVMNEITIETVRTFEAHSDDPRYLGSCINFSRDDSLTRRRTILRVEENKSIDHPVSTVCERTLHPKLLILSRIVSLIYAAP